METGTNSQTAPHLKKKKWIFPTGGKLSASPAVAVVNEIRTVGTILRQPLRVGALGFLLPHSGANQRKPNLRTGIS
jgi:hypothetical protein